MKYLNVLVLTTSIFIGGCSAIQLDPENTQLIAPKNQQVVNPNSSSQWDKIKNNITPTVGWKMQMD